MGVWVWPSSGKTRFRYAENEDKGPRREQSPGRSAPGTIEGKIRETV